MNILRKSSLILAGTAVAGLLAFACADSGSIGDSSSEINASFAEGLVIAKVYAGGGTNNGPLDGDYVQLYNSTNHGIPRKLLAIQVAAGNNKYDADYRVDLADPADDKAEIGSGKYFLVALTPGATLDGRNIDVTASAIPSDTDGGAPRTLKLLAGGGSVALVNTEDLIGCEGQDACSTSGAISIFGYGKISNATPLAEKTAFQALSATNSAARKLGGCWVKGANGDNSVDFEVSADPKPFDKEGAGLNCLEVDAGSDAGPVDETDAGPSDDDAGPSKPDAGPSKPDAGPTTGEDDGEGDDDGETPSEPVVGKKKKTNFNPDTQPIAQSKSSGCSSAPGTGSSGVAGALGIGLALAALGRRRKK